MLETLICLYVEYLQSTKKEGMILIKIGNKSETVPCDLNFLKDRLGSCTTKKAGVCQQFSTK